MLAEKCAAAVPVIHVTTPMLPPPVGQEYGPLPAGPPLEETLRQARDLLAAFVREHVSGLAQPVVSELRVGLPHLEICRYAGEAAVDIIVIGTHARGIVHRIFVGSTSKAVLERAPGPVLMVPLAALEKM
jgi:nucleotide-binding universal stress UspA family protein